MHKIPRKDTISCCRCTFTAFCNALVEEQSSSHQSVTVIKQQKLKRNEQLYSPKDKFLGLYVIQRGAIKIYQIDKKGNELIRGFYFAGEVFGYDAISTGFYSSYSIALGETIVCEVSYDDFLKLLHEKPDLQRHILYFMSQQLNANLYFASMSAEQRVATCLLEFSQRLQHLNVNYKFYLPMSREELGNYLGLATETVSRILSNFKKQKWIAIENKTILLLEPEKLQYRSA